MAKHRAQVAQIVNALPTHADFVKQYAPASPDAWKGGASAKRSASGSLWK